MSFFNGWDFYYSVPFFNEIFSRACNSHFRKGHLKILDDLDLNGKTTLELGAGTGLLSRKLYENYNTSPHLVDANKHAYLRFKEMGGVGKYIVSNVFDVDLDKKFDLVFSDGLIEHFSPEDQVKLVEIHKKFCNPNGYVLISAPIDGLRSKMFSAVITYEKGYKKGELADLMSSCGLSVFKTLEINRYCFALSKN